MIGVSEEKFNDSDPKSLRPYEEAFKLKEELEDQHNYMMGIYMFHAISTSLSNAFSKSKHDYLKEPLLQRKNAVKNEENKQGFTDAERFGMWAIAFNKKTNSDWRAV